MAAGGTSKRYTVRRNSVTPFPVIGKHPTRRLPTLFALGCLLLSAPLLAEDAAKAPPAPPPLKLTSPEATVQYHVLAGEIAAGRHMPAVAAAEFLEALKIVPDPKLASRATGLALAANDDDLALQAAKRWREVEPASLESREVVTLLSVRRGLMAEAYEQCAAIVKDHPGGEADGFRHVALILASESKQKEMVLALLQKLVGEHPQLGGAHYALGLVALRYNELPLAEKAAGEALRLEPKSTDSQMLLVGVQIKKGDLDAADETMNHVIRGARNAADLRMGYARLLLESQRRDRARQQFASVLKAEPDNADARYALGLMALEDQKLDEATAQFSVLAAKGERRNEAAYYMGRIAEIQNQPDKALAWYDKVQGGSQSIDAAVRSALMLGKLKKVPEARTALADLRDQFPSLATQFYAVEGELLLNSGDPAKALELYNSALSQRLNDPDLLYGRSLAFERLGRVDMAEADLRQILKTSKDDARALNALGYMLTLHTANLDEARKLLDRALELEPDDAAVIDSVGWLQFKLGNLPEARSLLKKAYGKTPDPEIAAHLGEVMWSMGEKDEARTLLNSALREAPDHEVLKETLDRLGK
jgi:tetratricopeptide (TPR) repeat protein